MSLVPALLKKMTVEEKVKQLTSLLDRNVLTDGELNRKNMKSWCKHGMGFIGSIGREYPVQKSVEIMDEIQRFCVEGTRLGIPVIMHDECLHGNMSWGATIFPQSIASGATFDPDHYRKVAAAIGKETRARGYALALSPTINIARDARCGRVEETYGEDSLITERMGLAFIKGMQSNGVGCTIKHLVANFMGDGGRDSWDVKFSEYELRETYFPAYKACIQKGKVCAIMPAYGTVNGVPTASDSWLLKDVVRGEWGFKGINGSDYWAVDYLYQKHFTAKDPAESARNALMGGMDVEWPNSMCYPTLVKQVKSGKIPMHVLNKSSERVLRLKERLGLFKNPYSKPKRAIQLANCEEHRTLALESARKSIVLLKNEKLLPLSRKIKKVAVIGPNANVGSIGGYSSKGTSAISPVTGISAIVGKEHVIYERGCSNQGGTKAGIARAVKAARKAEAVVLCLGQVSGGSWLDDSFTEGEGRDRSSLRLPGLQEELLLAVAKANRNVTVVLFGGSAVVMEKWVDSVKSVVMAWYNGNDGGTAVAETVFGLNNPGGKLPITFPVREGVLPHYYNEKPNGRQDGYNDLRTKLHMFPFGHGLSYTKFDYSGLRIQKTKKSGIKINLTVKNAGRRAGDEVVQLYIHDEYSSMTRPFKELKDFRRISLKPGASERVAFELTKKQLSFLNSKFNMVFEPGEFNIMIGSSSDDIRLSRIVDLK